MSFITFNNLSRFEQGIKDVLIQKFGDIASIIGSTTLNTTSQTLKGSINEVAEKSIQTVSGSNIKIQSGIINLTEGTSGTEVVYEFDEPFDAPPAIVLTPMRISSFGDVDIWLMDSSATEFVIFRNGYAEDLDSVSVMWLAIGPKI